MAETRTEPGARTGNGPNAEPAMRRGRDLEGSRSIGTTDPLDPAEPLEPDESLGSLLSRLTGDFGKLVSTQVEIAKVELREEVRDTGKSAGMLGAGAATGYLASILLSFAAAWGLAEVIPEGFAFLIVGLVWAVVAGVLLTVGRKKMADVAPIAPTTQQTLKEDVQWARQQTS